MSKTAGLAAATSFVGCVVLANYLTARFHFIPVGLGQTAAAGTFAAGLALGLRDIIQDTLGRIGSVVAVGAGAALSLAVAPPALAAASGLAFLVSELADLAVYTPLRSRGQFGGKRWVGAVAASNLVGAVVDTAIFLAVAFGASAVLPGMAGQLIGKGWATLAVVAVGLAVANTYRRAPREVPA